MGEQSATRLKGDDFQHLYSWFELLSLLDPKSLYAYGYVEHPAAGAADDVTLHSDLANVPAKYTQVKYHVDQRSDYSTASLVALESGAAHSLLHKLYESWNNLRQAEKEKVEVWLVSNWSSSSDLGRFIHDTCGLKDDFFVAGHRSEAAKIRKHWRNELQIKDEELNGFCRALRFRLGFGGFNELEDRVDDRMARYGLRTGREPRAIILDIVRDWIKKGGKSKRVDKSVLEKVIHEHGLRASGPEQPQVSLWIHAWAKRFYDLPPTVELDWTKFFDIETRTVPDQTVWDSTLLPQLKSARDTFAKNPHGSYIDLRAKMPLSASVVVGYIFAEAMGFQFRVEQPSGGDVQLWRSNVGASSYSLNTSMVEGSTESDIGLVSVSVTGDATPDIERQFAHDRTSFRFWTDFHPGAGQGAKSLTSANDAVSVAEQVKEGLRRLRAQHNLRELWLFFYCPATLALFVGQRLNTLGKIILFERNETGRYSPAIRIDAK